MKVIQRADEKDTFAADTRVTSEARERSRCSGVPPGLTSLITCAHLPACLADNGHSAQRELLTSNCTTKTDLFPMKTKTSITKSDESD